MGRDHRAQASYAAAAGYAPPPEGATVGDLLDKYCETVAKHSNRTKRATLAMLHRELDSVKLAALNALHLRELIDKRIKAGAGGVTIASDLSTFSAALKWGRMRGGSISTSG